MEELKMQNNLLMQLVKTLQNQINSKNRQNQILFQQYEQLANDNQIIQAELEGHRSQIRQFKRGSISSSQSQEYQTAQLSQKTESQVKELRRRLAEDTNNIQTIQAELKQKTDLVAELQDNLQAIKSQFAEMQKQAKLVLSLREANKKMEKALKINSQENNRLNEDINAMTQELQNLTKEKEYYMQYSESNLMDKQAIIRQLMEKVEELKETATLGSHLGIKEYQERIGQLQASLQQKEIIFGQLQERITIQETRQSFMVEQLNSKIADYERQINDLKQYVANRQQDIRVLSQLNLQIGTYQMEINGLKQTISNKDHHILTLNQFSNEQCKKNKEMQDIIQKLNSPQADKRQVLQSQKHNQKVEELQDIIKNKDSSILELRDFLQSQIDQVNSLKEQISQLKTTQLVEAIPEQKQHTNEHQNEEMRAALSTKEDELASTQAIVKEKEGEIRRMQQTIVGKDQMLQNLRRMVEKQSLELKTINNTKKEEIDNQRDKKDIPSQSQESTIQSLKDAIEGQKQRIEELQYALTLSSQSHNTCRERVQELQTLVNTKEQLIAELITSLNDPKPDSVRQQQIVQQVQQEAHDSAARTSQILQRELYQTMQEELDSRMREKKQVVSQMQLLAQQRYMELDNIKTDIREKEQRKKELQEEMQQRQRLLEGVSNSIVQLNEEIQHLKSKRQIVQKQNEGLEAAVSQKQIKVASLQITIKSHEDKIRKLNSIQSENNRNQVEQLLQGKTKKQPVIMRQQLSVQIRQLQSQLQTLQAEKEEQTSTMMNIMEALQEQIRFKAEVIDSLTDQINQLKSNSPQQLHSTGSNEGELRLQLLNQRGECSLLQRQVKQLQQENTLLKQNVDSLGIVSLNDDDLRRQLLQQRGELCLFERQVKQLQEEITSLRGNIPKQQQQSDSPQYKQLRMQLLQQRGELSLLQRQVKQLQEQNASLRQNVGHQQKRQLSEQPQYKQLRMDLLQQRGECSLLERQLQQLQEITSLRQNGPQKQQQVCSSCGDLRRQLLNQRGQYSLLERELKQLSDQNISLRQNVVMPKQQLSDEAEYKKLRMQLLDLRGEYSLLERQMKWLQEQNALLKQNVPQQSQQSCLSCDELRRQLLTKSGEYSLLERQLKDLKEQIIVQQQNAFNKLLQKSRQGCTGCGQLRQQLFNQRGQYSVLEGQLLFLQQELQFQQQNNKQQPQQLTCSNCDDLRRCLFNQQEQYSLMQREFKQFVNETALLRQNIVVPKQELSDETEYKKLRMQLLQQRGEYSLLQLKLKSLQEENAQLKQNKVTQQQQLSDEPVYKQLRMTLLQKRGECSLLERQIKQLQEENESLKQEVVSLNERLSKQQNSQLQKEYAKVEMEQVMLQNSQGLAERYRQELQQMKHQQSQHNQSEDQSQEDHLTAAQTLEQLLIYSKEGQNIESIRRMIHNLRKLYEKELQGLQHQNNDLKGKAAQLIIINDNLTVEVHQLQQQLAQKQIQIQQKSASIEELQRNMRELQDRFSRQIFELRSSIFEESPIIERQESGHQEVLKDEMEKEIDVIRKLKQEIVKIKKQNKIKDEEIIKLRPNFAKELNDLLADSLINNNEQEREALERVTAERDELASKCQEYQEQIRQMEQQNKVLTSSVEQKDHKKVNDNKHDNHLEQRQQGELTDRAYQKATAVQNRHSRSYDHHLQQEQPFDQQPFDQEEIQFSLIEKNEIIAELEGTILQIEKGFNAEIMSLRRNIAELNNQIISLRKKLYESNPHAIGIAELINGSFAQQKNTEFYRYDFPKYSQSHFTSYPQVNQSRSSYRTEDRRLRDRIKTEFLPNRELTLGEKIIGRKCRGGPFISSQARADLNTNSIRVDASQWQSRLPA